MHMHIYDTHLLFLEPLLQELTGFARVTSGTLRARGGSLSSWIAHSLWAGDVEACWSPLGAVLVL